MFDSLNNKIQCEHEPPKIIILLQIGQEVALFKLKHLKCIAQINLSPCLVIFVVLQ